MDEKKKAAPAAETQERQRIDPIKLIALIASTISLVVSILVRCGTI